MSEDDKYADWRAWQAVAVLHSAGRPVPAVLQARVNAAIARAVSAKKLPERPRGRPEDAPRLKLNNELRAALGVAALTAAGISLKHAVEEIAGSLGGKENMDTAAIYRYAKAKRSVALELLDYQSAGALDLVESQEVARAAQDALNRVVTHDFQVLSQRNG